jgi:excisionase family DNA binding protein
VRRELEPIIAGLRSEIEETVPKTVAARLLGVSVPTLNKWIARGLNPATSSGRYRRIPRDPLLELAEQVDVIPESFGPDD